MKETDREELQLIEEFEANFNPTKESKARRIEILNKLIWCY